MFIMEDVPVIMFKVCFHILMNVDLEIMKQHTSKVVIF